SQKRPPHSARYVCGKAESRQLEYPDTDDHGFSTKKCNRWTDESEGWYEKKQKEKTQTRSNTSAGEKALLFIKRGEKILKECRKKEWDEAQAKKLHRWNGRQVFWSQCYFKDRFGPCHEKRGHRNADEQKEFEAHP